MKIKILSNVMLDGTVLLEGSGYDVDPKIAQEFISRGIACAESIVEPASDLQPAVELITEAFAEPLIQKESKPVTAAKKGFGKKA